jgi:hypothetical protein
MQEEARQLSFFGRRKDDLVVFEIDGLQVNFKTDLVNACPASSYG